MEHADGPHADDDQSLAAHGRVDQVAAPILLDAHGQQRWPALFLKRVAPAVHAGDELPGSGLRDVAAAPKLERDELVGQCSPQALRGYGPDPVIYINMSAACVEPMAWPG